jgi:hypothetical protein
MDPRTMGKGIYREVEEDDFGSCEYSSVYPFYISYLNPLCRCTGTAGRTGNCQHVQPQYLVPPSNPLELLVIGLQHTIKSMMILNLIRTPVQRHPLLKPNSGSIAQVRDLLRACKSCNFGRSVSYH